MMYAFYFGHTFYCFFDGGGVAEAQIPGYITVHVLRKCYIDNLVIASKYKRRTITGICCIQPSLFLCHPPSFAELNRISGRNISTNVEVKALISTMKQEQTFVCCWIIHFINPFFMYKSVPRSLSQNL